MPRKSSKTAHVLNLLTGSKDTADEASEAPVKESTPKKTCSDKSNSDSSKTKAIVKKSAKTTEAVNTDSKPQRKTKKVSAADEVDNKIQPETLSDDVHADIQAENIVKENNIEIEKPETYPDISDTTPQNSEIDLSAAIESDSSDFSEVIDNTEDSASHDDPTDTADNIADADNSEFSDITINDDTQEYAAAVQDSDDASDEDDEENIVDVTSYAKSKPIIVSSAPVQESQTEDASDNTNAAPVEQSYPFSVDNNTIRPNVNDMSKLHDMEAVKKETRAAANPPLPFAYSPGGEQSEFRASPMPKSAVASMIISQRRAAEKKIKEESKAVQEIVKEEPHYENSEMTLVNLTEKAAQRRIPEIMNKFNMCSCERCYYDVLALTLNSIPQKSVIVPKDDIEKKLTEYELDSTVDLITSISKSCVHVKISPRH